MTKLSNPMKTLAIAALLAAPGPALAQASRLQDLVGVRGSSADNALGQRGYNASGNMGAATMYWNGSRSSCVSVLVDNGRIQSIQDASDSNCGHGGGGSSAAAGVIAGAAIIGLAAALSSHHRNTNDRHRQQANHDAEYERGYHDGLYGAHYDRDDSEAYHNGYMAGEAENSNRRASSRRYVRGAPQAALVACAQRADEFQNVPRGSSVAVGVDDLGRGNYEMVMASGHYRSRCSVDSRGRVSDMNPY